MTDAAARLGQPEQFLGAECTLVKLQCLRCAAHAQIGIHLVHRESSIVNAHDSLLRYKFGRRQFLDGATRRIGKIRTACLSKAAEALSTPSSSPALAVDLHM